MEHPSGSVVGTLSSLDGSAGEACLADGRKLAFDVCILALGSGYAEPIKPNATFPSTVPDRLAEYDRAHTSLAAATSVVVVGGGTVGVELAAEIVGKWTGRGAKKVTLVTSGKALLGRMPARAGRLAAAWLRARGVELVENTRVASFGEHDGVVVLESGRRIPADVVYRCLGSPPCTSQLAIADAAPPEGAAIAVSDSLQVLRSKSVGGGDVVSNVFVAGDACSASGEKNALNADLNAALCATNATKILFNGSGGGEGLARWPMDVCFGRRRSSDVVVVSVVKV